MPSCPDSAIIEKYFESTEIKFKTFSKEYEINNKVKALGKGSYAEVFVAVHRLSKIQFAVKKYVTSRSSSTIGLDLKTEFEIMKILLHPHILRAFEAINDNGNCYLITEYCTGGELFDRIISKLSFTEKEVQILIGQIMDALYYMHSVGVVHRDIKPENIIYFDKSKDFKVKLVDFGVSKRFNHEDNDKPEFHSFIASKYYVAPEILQDNPCYSKEVDCWAVGVIVYIILVGYAPFDGKTSVEVYKKILRKPVVYFTQEWKHFSKESLHFTKSLLVKNPMERLTSKQAVEHPWLNGPNLHTFHFKNALSKSVPLECFSKLSTSDTMIEATILLNLEKTNLQSSLSLKAMNEINRSE